MTDRKRHHEPEEDNKASITKESVSSAVTKTKVPKTILDEFKDLFPGGIPDGVSYFIKNSDIPIDVMKNIFGFLPKFSKKEYKVVLVGDGGVGKGDYINALKYLFDYDTLIMPEDVVALKMKRPQPRKTHSHAPWGTPPPAPTSPAPSAPAGPRPTSPGCAAGPPP